MTKRPPTPTGWSDTDWIKKLQDDEENPLACLHINQGSFDAAADAYEEEYKMSERTALDIATDLDAASCSSFAKLEAAEALRQQHAEIERLSAINSALTAKSNALVDENAWLIEKIGQLTDEKFRRFNNEECWIYQRSGENHLGTLTCPVVISPDALLSMKGEISTLTADRDAAIAAADALRAALLNIHALRPIGLSASVYALTVENIARSAIAKAAEEKA